jgi:hypothetical protein
MPTVPGYDQVVIRRAATPSFTDSGAIQRAASTGQQTSALFEQAVNVSLNIQRENDKVTLNDALIQREREKIDSIDTTQKMFQNNPEGYRQFFEKEQQKKDAERLKTLPPSVQEAYNLSVAESNVRDYERNLNWENGRRIELIGSKINQTGNTLAELSYTYGQRGEDFNEIAKNIDATIISGAGVLADDKLQNFDSKIRTEAAQNYIYGAMAVDAQRAQQLLASGQFSTYFTGEELTKLQKTVWEKTPDIKKLNEIQLDGNPAENADRSIDIIMRNEGGYTKEDGKSGHPAIYGINRGPFKKEHDEAKRITETQGKAAGEAYARQFYKREFYDKYKIGELPLQVQDIVADGVINHGTTFRNKLVQAAKDGSSPQELIEMRRQEYVRLAKNDPEKYEDQLQGWQTRLNNLPIQGGGGYYGNLSTGEKLNQQEVVLKNILADPAKAAIETGASTPAELVQVQQQILGFDKENASVLTKTQASVFGASLAQVNNADEALSQINQLIGTYGEYTPNAIQDLKRNKSITPAMEAAMSLAHGGRPENKEHIELLINVSRSGKAALSELYQQGGFLKSNLTSKVKDKTEDLQTAILNEGKSFEDVQEKIDVVESLSMARMLQRKTSSESDAVEFAMKPFNGSYEVAEVNDAKFRVPTAYSASQIENSIETFLKESLPEIINQRDKEIYELQDIAAPFLNEKETGYKFRSIDGNVLVDKAGKEIDISFEQLLKGQENKKRKEKEDKYRRFLEEEPEPRF